MLTRDRLDRPVDTGHDHILGPPRAEITLVEYGSYACPHCRAANDRIAAVRDRFGQRLRYVFRHRPLTGSELARRAAELVERIDDPERFWDAHIKLMTRSESLTEEDLAAVAADHGVEADGATTAAQRAAQRVETDLQSAHKSGVRFIPGFFINGRRYDGAWDESAFTDAIIGSLGFRVRTAALDFARWAPSAGLLLVLASVTAVLLMNSSLGPGFEAFWEKSLALAF